jgi:hypothetical protein
VHVHGDLHGHLAPDDELHTAVARYFNGDPYDPAVPDIVADYREKKMAAVIFTVDAEGAASSYATLTRCCSMMLPPTSPA